MFIVATPHELAAEQTVAEARAGKHVLVEKPMAIRVADCPGHESQPRVPRRGVRVGTDTVSMPGRTERCWPNRLGRFGPVRLIYDV